MKIRILN